MKKMLSFVMALVIVFTILAVPAYATENVPVTYTPTCPLCGERLSSRGSNYPDQLRTVDSCAAYNGPHMHYSTYYVRNWECHTVDCELIGYVVYKEGPVVVKEDCCNITDAIV